MSLTRRKMFLLLPGAILSDALVPGASAADDGILPSASFPFASLPVHASDQAEIRPVLKGKLTTGESIEVHETTLQPGSTPHAPHRHVHSEMWLIREGTVEITVEGETHQIGPGSVGFVRSNDEHRIKNMGTTPAIYFVVAMGPGAGTS
jgi:mannose-6-phosphate isomerase-like protein (cupin superfamily)